MSTLPVRRLTEVPGIAGLKDATGDMARAADLLRRAPKSFAVYSGNDDSALSLMLLPQIAWESHRALTHSVLATALAALTCLVFVARTLPGRRGGYLLFGVVAGLGILSRKR